MKAFKAVRIAALLLVLASVWTTLNLQKNVTRDWQGTIDIKIVPVIADDQPQTRQFVKKLDERVFSEIEKYIVEQANRYDRELDYSLNITLAQSMNVVPPQPPARNEGRLAIMFWSLKLRWWAWRNESEDHHALQTRLYVLYQSPDKGELLPHSTGLQNGLIGLIHARAQKNMARYNNVILVHELLHILGASDKYDLASGNPKFPEGYAQPEKQPRYPQQRAEIMGRAIPLSEDKFDVAVRLSQTLLGEQTAQEIGWLAQSSVQ